MTDSKCKCPWPEDTLFITKHDWNCPEKSAKDIIEDIKAAKKNMQTVENVANYTSYDMQKLMKDLWTKNQTWAVPGNHTHFGVNANHYSHLSYDHPITHENSHPKTEKNF